MQTFHSTIVLNYSPPPHETAAYEEEEEKKHNQASQYSNDNIQYELRI